MEAGAGDDGFEARYQAGLKRMYEGDFEGGLGDLVGLLSEAPGHLNLRYDVAMTQMMLGMYEEACENLLHILALDPQHEKALEQAAYC